MMSQLVSAKRTCGCEVLRDWTIRFCPLHANAGNLLAAGKSAREWLGGDGNQLEIGRALGVMFDSLSSYYTYFERTSMQPHEERVIAERKELEDKLIKLRVFIGSGGLEPNPIYSKLPADEQARLKTQEFHMSMYWRVLGDRIAEFPK
jgi:hypothetical protein